MKKQYKYCVLFDNIVVVIEMNYLYILIATVLAAVEFVLTKKYQSYEGNELYSGLKFNALNGFFAAIMFFVLSGFRWEFSWFSLILAALMAMFSLTYIIFGFKTLKLGSVAVYSIFLMSGGMLLPYIFGILFLDEEVNIFRIIGVVVILIAIVISNKSKYKFSYQFYLLCIGIFLLNGCVSIVSKTHQINQEFVTVSTVTFVMLSGLMKFVFCSIIMLFMNKEKRKTGFSSNKSLYAVLSAALIGGISYMLQLIGAKGLPATVLYPLISGGVIMFSALLGRLCFKEKLSKYQYLSIALIVAGTLCFL